jgi:hypothetical protein
MKGLYFYSVPTQHDIGQVSIGRNIVIPSGIKRKWDTYVCKLQRVKYHCSTSGFEKAA